MLNTYRKFKDTKEVIYISEYDEEDNQYYCEFEWRFDDYYFNREFLEENSKPANFFDKIKYLINRYSNDGQY